MRIRSFLQRGAPIYVTRGNSTISLVPEVSVWELRLEWPANVLLRSVSPVAVFVIDDRGVTRLSPRRIRLWLPGSGVVRRGPGGGSAKAALFVSAAFGSPLTAGGRTIIPVASRIYLLRNPSGRPERVISRLWRVGQIVIDGKGVRVEAPAFRWRV